MVVKMNVHLPIVRRLSGFSALKRYDTEHKLVGHHKYMWGSISGPNGEAISDAIKGNISF